MDDPINVKKLGALSAIGDGAPHPLSERYATLADAQVHVPFATDLSQELDWAAIQAAIWSAGTPDDPRGTTVLVPRGNYLCSDALHLSRQVRLAGVGRGATRLTFGPGAGVIVDDSRTSPDGGHGSYATIADLDIAGERVTGIEQWRPGERYQPGQRVCDRNDNRFYFECLLDGYSRSTASPWTADVPYNEGDVVRASGPIYFLCIGASGDQKSGGEEPVWALPVDETMWDGTGAGSHESADRVLWRRILAPPPLPAVNRGTWTSDTVYNPGDYVEATSTFKERLLFRSQQSANAGPDEPAWEADAPGAFPASYTGGTHPRGAYLQGLPSLLLGAPQGPIQVGAYHTEPTWPGEPGDIVLNTAQDSTHPSYQPYAGWICVVVPAPPPENTTRKWKRFGKIELEP